MRLAGYPNWARGWLFSLFRGVDCEGEGPEPIIVGALRMVEKQFPRLGEFVPFHVEFIE
jgi:hypothetical protein